MDRIFPSIGPGNVTILRIIRVGELKKLFHNNSIPGIVPQKLTWFERGFNGRYSFKDVMLSIFLILKGHHLGFCQKCFDAT
jgi:hypothetical protein